MIFFFVFRLFTNFLQGACITFVIKEHKIKHCHSQLVFGTGIGGIHSLCPRLGLRPSPELWAHPSNASAGLKTSNKGEVCKGHPTSTSPGKAIHSVRAVHLPQHRPQRGHTGHMHLPACPGLASGRTRRQRGYHTTIAQ